MLDKLLKVKNALLEVPCPLFHYFATKKPDRYMVWAEDGETSSLEADDCKQDQVIGGYIDYFTKMDDDPNVGLIQETMKDSGISFSFDSAEFEEETRYIHYVWRFEVV